MTRSRGSPPEEGSTETETLELNLRWLVEIGAPADLIGDEAMRCLERLLGIEHLHLAALHASDYGDYWDDARKLDVLSRLRKADMTAQAITLCHRWKLSALCDKKNHRLYRELFPKLPPRTDKKERP